MKFEEYIKGKRVVLVGPSNRLIGAGNGPIIDKYDVVIRFNKALPLPEKYKDDLGVKVDVLCNCLENHPHTGGILNPVLWKKSGVKYVLAPFPHGKVSYNLKKNSTINSVGKHLPIAYIDNEIFKQDKKNLLSAPTTGFSCLTYLLSLDAKEIWLCGMDFYRTIAYKEYFQDKITWETAVSTFKRHQKEAKENLGKQMEGHNIDSEFNYFKNNIYENSKIKVDDNLIKFLKK